MTKPSVTRDKHDRVNTILNQNLYRNLDYLDESSENRKEIIEVAR
jgi:hypothetical protein